jgi:hypothetical protein
MQPEWTGPGTYRVRVQKAEGGVVAEGGRVYGRPRVRSRGTPSEEGYLRYCNPANCHTGTRHGHWLRGAGGVAERTPSTMQDQERDQVRVRVGVRVRVTVVGPRVRVRVRVRGGFLADITYGKCSKPPFAV